MRPRAACNEALARDGTSIANKSCRHALKHVAGQVGEQPRLQLVLRGSERLLVQRERIGLVHVKQLAAVTSQQHFNAELPVLCQGRHDDALIEVVAVGQENHRAQMTLKAPEKGVVEEVGVMGHAGEPCELSRAAVVDAARNPDADRFQGDRARHEAEERARIEPA